MATRGRVVGAWDGGCASSASDTSPSASRTTVLMRCQGSRTWQLDSWVQAPGCTKWWLQEQRAYSGRFRTYINSEAMHAEVDPVYLGNDMMPKQSLDPDA